MLHLADDAEVLDNADIDAVACPGFPPSPARATFDIEDCKDLAAGETCDADCLDENDDGFVTATCKADGTFEVTGSCAPIKEGKPHPARVADTISVSYTVQWLVKQAWCFSHLPGRRHL